ncbi:hypothetical protein AURDEDRAFT_178717 [Auricularia subglabra TFB-10046 SS5]|uniref:Uncharacterized protein n=1 Tax=Auricularia subglabra (strain TFB-10046 / SS5) TaxID=717982 RepID=J0WIX8_AURST|nr:hypothetical protein AURDEDRAFT_178717 [Auricularia subglabra TFB-10046 SS5]
MHGRNRNGSEAICCAQTTKSIGVPFLNSHWQTPTVPTPADLHDDNSDIDALSSSTLPTMNECSADTDPAPRTIPPSDVEQTVFSFLDYCARGPLDPSIELPTIAALQNVSDTFAEAFLKPYYDAWTRQRNPTHAMRKSIEANMLDYIMHPSKYEYKRCPAATTSGVGTPARGQENGQEDDGK